MRIVLGVEYHGTNYCGWQSQPQHCAVQDYLEKVLSSLAGHTVETTCAGRTDAGVHALQQVVHFDTNASRPLTAWVRGSNAGLPSDVTVLWSRQVDESFHARYSALSRTYHYILLNRFERPGVLKNQVGWCHHPLDLTVMREAAELFIGEKDFSSFRSTQCQANSAIRCIKEFTVAKKNNIFIFRIRADAFLHHMVRNIVSTLVEVGKAKYSLKQVEELIGLKDRKEAPATFMPDGLYLAEIEYPETFAMPRRNGLTDVFL